MADKEEHKKTRDGWWRMGREQQSRASVGLMSRPDAESDQQAVRWASETWPEGATH